MAALKIVRRSEWGARPPRSVTLAPDTQTRDCLHHTTGRTLGAPASARWVRNIQDYHMLTLGWDDIGYNWLVDAAGAAYEGRGDRVVGAHARGHNSTHRGIAFLGDSRDITEAAKATIRALVGGRRCVGHRDLDATACPGDEIYRWMMDGMPLAASFRTEAPVNDEVFIQVSVRKNTPKYQELVAGAARLGLRVWEYDPRTVRITRLNPPGTPQ